MAAPTITFFFLLLLLCKAHSFVFNSFKSSQPNLTLSGSALITRSGLLQLTNSSRNQTANVFYSNPFHLLSTKQSNATNITSAVSFSTTFIFTILTAIRGGAGGHGFSFAISPTRFLPLTPSANPNYLGLFNPQNDGKASNHIFAVEFDTAHATDAVRIHDINDNHIGIDINGMNTLSATPAAYYNNDAATETLTNLQMESDNAFQAWIDYDGGSKTVNVTISPIHVNKPTKPLISRQIDLSPIFKRSMFVGFTSATGKLASAHYILAWSFRLHRPARPLDLTRIPNPPTRSDQPAQFRNTGIRVGAVTSAATLFIIICAVVASVLLIKRMKMRDVVEEWERDFPHRFKYAHLHAATDGFSDCRIVGKGGFGCVYKGIMQKTKQVIAVKKIGHNSKQGVKEFVAEVVTLGKLRHRHLVHLEGWCKRSSHLLLVYEFMSEGSLDSFLFGSGRILRWTERFRIIKEVAAGLVYLHHEWEQVVVHRDVKANNVLLDCNMTAKLGDFGLAKLYEHGDDPATTHVVGTVGYIAPELAHNGRATEKSDVYAFGALVFEVVCGKRPFDSSSGVLVQDWVWECWKMGRIWEVVDLKLGNEYVKSEVELVLKVGLNCSHYEAEARPRMDQVVKYLGRFDSLPDEVDGGVVNNVGWNGGEYSDPPSSSGGVMSTASFGTSGANGVLVVWVSSGSLFALYGFSFLFSVLAACGGGVAVGGAPVVGVLAASTGWGLRCADRLLGGWVVGVDLVVEVGWRLKGLVWLVCWRRRLVEGGDAAVVADGVARWMGYRRRSGGSSRLTRQ
ncbi:unnamed protein product [Rhodiola kirilowii]